MLKILKNWRELWNKKIEKGEKDKRAREEIAHLPFLLAEARKHRRKMIVSHQVEPYRGLGVVLRSTTQVLSCELS